MCSRLCICGYDGEIYGRVDSLHLAWSHIGGKGVHCIHFARWGMEYGGMVLNMILNEYLKVTYVTCAYIMNVGILHTQTLLPK